jgi:hypothetical protein
VVSVVIGVIRREYVMRARFVKKGTRLRAMVRTSTVEVFNAVTPAIKELGLEEVGPIGFWRHVLFWWWGRKRAG